MTIQKYTVRLRVNININSARFITKGRKCMQMAWQMVRGEVLAAWSDLEVRKQGRG